MVAIQRQPNQQDQEYDLLGDLLLTLPPDSQIDSDSFFFSSFDMNSNPTKHGRKGSNSYKNLNYSATGQPKDLSHVPCKFFKVGACAAGASCPFSHNLPEPGQGKSVCQWFVKGNCKFGHKCALAHILPGQAMSMDRRNKRAAQAAAREAAAAAVGSGDAPLPSNTGSNKSSSKAHNRSHSAAPIGISTTGISVSSPGPQVSPTTTRLSSALSSMLDNTSNSSLTSPPVVTLATSTVTTATTPMSNGQFGEDGIGIVNAGAGGASAVAAMQNILMTSGGTIRGRAAVLRSELGSSNQNANTRDPSPFQANTNSTSLSVSPQTPSIYPPTQGPPGLQGYRESDYFEHEARRQSFSSNGRSISPAARMDTLTNNYHVTVGAQMFHPSGLSISPPNPTPINFGSQHQPTTSNMFSTSPFSAPGSKSVFFSQSYDGNDDSRFAGRSLPFLDDFQPSHAKKMGTLRSPFDSDDDDDLEFVPSSLSELLTEEEMSRRSARQSFGQQVRQTNGLAPPTSQGLSGSFDPFDLPLSRSVPLDSMFNRQVGSGRDEMAGRSNVNQTTVIGAQRSTLLTNPTGYATPSHLTLQQQFLRTQTSRPGLNINLNLSTANGYSSGSYVEDEISLANIISPGRARTIQNHAPGSSLPQGLAAGLSRLHLTPAQHTGETPPSSFSQSGFSQSMLSPTSPTLNDSMNTRSTNFSPQSWGSDPPSPHAFSVVGSGQNPPGLKLPTSTSRTRVGVSAYHFSSPLSKGGLNYEESKDSLGTLGSNSLVSPQQIGLSSPKQSLFDDGIFDMDGIST